MFILLKVRKSIQKTISELTIANKKVFSKNLTFLLLSFTENAAITILNITKVEPLIF